MISSLEEIKQNQYMMYQEKRSISASLKSLNTTMDKALTSIQGIEANTTSMNGYLEHISKNSDVIAQVAAGGVCMALGHIIPWWVPTVAFAIGLALAVIGLVSADTVVEQIQEQDEKLKRDVSIMRGLQSKVNSMTAQCEDADAAAAVKSFAEEIRYSDPVSNEAIAEAEAELHAAVDALQDAIVDGNADEIKLLCRKASAALAERNRLCKLNK